MCFEAFGILGKSICVFDYAAQFMFAFDLEEMINAL